MPSSSDPPCEIDFDVAVATADVLNQRLLRMQAAIWKPGSAVTDLAVALEHLVGRAVVVEENFLCLV